MHNDLALALQALQSGRWRDAEQRCRGVLAGDADNVDALHLLGVITAQTQRPAQAIELMSRALAIAPNTPALRINLTTALMADGRPTEAEAIIREAVRAAPHEAESHFKLGNVLAHQGKNSEAIASFLEAVRLQPRMALAHLNVGEVYRRTGKTDEAIAHFRSAIDLDPKLMGAYNNLAGILLERNQFNEAIRCLGKLLKLQPRSPRAFNNLGLALQAVGDVEQARVCYRNAVNLDPQNTSAWCNLGVLLSEVGEFQEAEECFAKLAAVEPDGPEAAVARAKGCERRGDVQVAADLLQPQIEKHPWHVEVAIAYATVLDQLDNPERARQVLQHLVDENPAMANRIPVRFTLGKICDRLERHDEAFHHYHMGNQLKAAACRFDRERHRRGIERLIETYSQERLSRYPRSTVPTELPIFIVGMPRSGTSLVEQILANHPRVHGGGELTFLHDLVQSTYSQSSSAPNTDVLAGEHRLVERHQGNLRVAPAGIEDYSVQQLDALAIGYLDRLRALNGDAERITDKMPFNFQHVGLIRLLFPNAPIIHCRRDTLDTCLSCYFQNFLRKNAYSYDLADLGVYYRRYEHLMKHWEAVGMQLFVVQYEELVRDPEPLVRRMLEYCQLDWDEACLRYHESKRVVHTASYQQIRKPIYTRSVERWKHYRQHLTPLIEALERGADLRGEQA